MASLSDFCFPRFNDGEVNFALEPAVPIGGWDIRFEMSRAFGGVPLVTKYLNSGYNGVSGITVTNSGQGQLKVQLYAAEVSGVQPGNIAYMICRYTSGARTELAKGYRIMDY